LPDFDAQCQALLSVAPRVVSSIMGVYPAAFVAELKARGILWFAVATTVAEATAAEKAGADAIVAQGSEAGGHRGAFDAEQRRSKWWDSCLSCRRSPTQYRCRWSRRAASLTGEESQLRWCSERALCR